MIICHIIAHMFEGLWVLKWFIPGDCTRRSLVLLGQQAVDVLQLAVRESITRYTEISLNAPYSAPHSFPNRERSNRNSIEVVW